MALVKLKRGDTFSFSANFTDAANLPLLGVASRLKGQVRDVSDKLLADMVVIEKDGGEYLFQVLNTDNWPIRTLYFDVQYTHTDGSVESSPTYTIAVEKDVTHD